MKSVLVTIAALCLITAGTAGQGIPYIPGQWTGPYELPIGNDLNSPTFEIAHAAVLPPAKGYDYDRVLFGVVPGGFCTTTAPDPGCATVMEGCYPPYADADKYGRTYLWLPRTPTNVALIDTPYPESCPTEMTQAFFCGGHTFLPDGDLLWVGGTDPATSCLNSPCGASFSGHPEA